MEDISFNRLNIQAQASVAAHPSTGLPGTLLKNIMVNTSSISPLLWARPMWDKTFIHLLRVPCSESASPNSHCTKSARLMKITLSRGWMVSHWTHNGNKEGERDRKRDRLRETKAKCLRVCVRVCQSRAVWISYSAVTLAPAIVEDTSASSSQGLVPTCIKGLSKALLTLPGFLPGSPKTKGFQSLPQTQWIPALLSLQYPAFQK